MENEFPIEGMYVEFWVADADAQKNYFRDMFGFRVIAQSTEKEGRRISESYVLAQGDIRLVVTAPLTKYSRVASFVRKHGDGVRDIAFLVDDARFAYELAIRRGAQSHARPRHELDSQGSVRSAAICAYGDVVHSFIENKNYHGVFLPGYVPVPVTDNHDAGLLAIDHNVGNVFKGDMDTWVAFYRDKLGFEQILHFSDLDINAGNAALMSKVMENGRVKFPINEPAGTKESHIDDYLRINNGPGVQHIAFASANIVDTVRKMRARGVRFLDVPDTYYEIIAEKFSHVAPAEIAELKELKILLDLDKNGRKLKQIFTAHFFEEDTIFGEVMEREGFGTPKEAEGFGHNNFQTLFEAKELDRSRRKI